MRLVTVNVNGVRAALRKGMKEWLDSAAVDVLCLQEVRAPEEILEQEFGAEWNILQQACEIKGRAGVAILSRNPLEDPLVAADALGESVNAPVHTGRWVEATVQGVRVVSAYVHSGTVGTPKMDEKFLFMDAMTERMRTLLAETPLAVITGDINTAHHERDLKNWKGNLKTAGFLPEERAYLSRWQEAGWVDIHRSLVGDVEGPYTWWSMRGRAFDNDAGWRIDYQWVTPELAGKATGAQVLKAESWDTRWSDHAPLIVDYAL